MQNRPLSSTPLTVSRLGLGLAALGRPGYINLGHADDLRRQLRRRRDGGAGHAVLDAAWQPASATSTPRVPTAEAEAFPGLLAAAPADRPGRGDGRLEMGLHLHRRLEGRGRAARSQGPFAAVLRRQFAESRELLGEHLDLYQIHSATLESGVLDNRAVLDELARLRDRG